MKGEKRPPLVYIKEKGIRGKTYKSEPQDPREELRAKYREFVIKKTKELSGKDYDPKKEAIIIIDEGLDILYDIMATFSSSVSEISYEEARNCMNEDKKKRIRSYVERIFLKNIIELITPTQKDTT